MASSAIGIASTATRATSEDVTSRPDSRMAVTRVRRDSTDVPPKRPIIMAQENAA
jgi:hypothetical protein